MKGTPPPLPLPMPARGRWQPLRVGLVELYHYDVEEFWFRDGHLLLRGNNGTGKSKVLSLTLPFLLDANLSSSRIEPDGERSKRMEWNLLMNGRHSRRIGYTWMELGRLDETGEIHTLTLGCGLKAIAGRSSVDTWYFITDQRIGADLWLTTHERTALSRERLEEAIGARGQVFTTAQTYRRAVDERLFQLGTDRYAALVDTLIQLRQPQLSKQPDERRLSDALTEALPPLDRTALEDVAEAMSELDDLRRQLEELEAMRKSVSTFVTRYRQYAQIASRRRARVVRQSQTEFDQRSRELNDAVAALEQAREQVVSWRNQEHQLDEELAADDAQLGVLREDPAMHDAKRIEDARRFAEQCRVRANEGAQIADKARVRTDAEVRATSVRLDESASTRSALINSRQQVSMHASHSGLLEALERSLAKVALPDGVLEAPKEFASQLTAALRDAEARRREQIALIRRRLREVEASLQLRLRAQDARTQCADGLDAASEALKLAVCAVSQATSELVGCWKQHVTALRALRVTDLDDKLAELEQWCESQSGANPLRLILETAWREHESQLSVQLAALGERRKVLSAEQAVVQDENTRLARGENRVPPAPYTRIADARFSRSGAPLWQLVDFDTKVPDHSRAGIEAALEASGLLDAWVMEDGSVLDAQTHDVLLVARKPCNPEHALSRWLVPTIPAEGRASSASAQVVAAVLDSIACSEVPLPDAEAWISPDGAFRLGALQGAWAKTNAEFIGHAAREAARLARLAALALELERIAAALAELDARSEQLEDLRQLGLADQAGAPSDEALLQAHAKCGVAEANRREAQKRLGDAESRLLQADEALNQAREMLTNDARDVSLPTDAEGIEEVDRALSEFRMASAELRNAIHSHQRTLTELAAQRDRERIASQDLEDAVGKQLEQRMTLRAADEQLNTLENTVGQKVEELLGRIERVERLRNEHKDASKRARAEFNAASGRRAAAESKHDTLRGQLEESVNARKHAIEELRKFALVTALLNVAIPDLVLPDGEQDWGIEAALTIARRAEQALSDIDSEERDWQRIQSTISRDLAELQTAMSAQGHAVYVDYIEIGLVVRITYQQKPERPDTLQQRIETDLNERRLVLTAHERNVLEGHLQKEIAANLQRMIQATEQRVKTINEELYRRPTSTGVRYRLDWQVDAENDENTVSGLAEARKRLLRTHADAWSVEDRQQVGEFLQARINAERLRDEQSTLSDNLARALDYRRWHRFRVQRSQDGNWKPLSGPSSSGERALGLTVPLFAAASSHYESAHRHAPRLVLLDEAFAGIDDEARADCMALIREFDLDFVMTSEREWGCYPQLPGLSICQLVRREGMDAVYVSRWTWDGKEKRTAPDIDARFPERVEDESAAR